MTRSDDPKKEQPWRDPAGDFGIGMVNGELQVLTPEQHREMAIQRNAEEALEQDDAEPE